MGAKAPTYELALGGRLASAGMTSNITRLVCETRFNETGHLEISIQNGSHFNLTPDDLKLGTRVELSLGYWQDLVPVFEGELVEFGPSADGNSIDTMILTAYDYSYLLKKEHELRNRPDMSLLAIVEDIIKTAPTDQGSDVKFEVVVGDKIAKAKAETNRGDGLDQEIKMTDWEVLDRIARMLNYKLIVKEKTLYIVESDYFSGIQTAEQKFTFIRSTISGELADPNTFPMISFDPTVGKAGQVTHVEVLSFDPFQPDGTRYKSIASKGSEAKGYTDIKVKSEVTETIRVHQIARTSTHAELLAESHLLRRAEQLVKGHVKVPLNTRIESGQIQNIIYRAFGDIGRQYSGEYRVEGVRHVKAGDQIYTEFDVRRDRLTEL